tara:strand:+ start:108 stop:770 length:663 start_codon:yes stop_codon:yes gene_type:complete
MNENNIFWRLYPQSKRENISQKRVLVPEKIRKKLQKFPKEYFDGERAFGYGGYYYNIKFFDKIVKKMIKYYRLKNNSKILDVGCAKGFMIYDFKQNNPNLIVRGIDISSYCKKNAHPKVKRFIKVGNCKKLPYKDNSFDLVISISTIHNLEKKFIKQALNELIRVSKGSIFIRVKAFKNIRQKKLINKWNLVAKSNLSEKQWIKLFKQVNFKGDYSFSKF